MNFRPRLRQKLSSGVQAAACMDGKNKVLNSLVNRECIVEQKIGS